MIKLITFTNGNEKLLEFNFNDCIIEYFSKTGWINVLSTKQKITIKGNSFIAYDENIKGVVADSAYFSMAKSWIQNFYKQNEKILIIFTTADEPLYTAMQSVLLEQKMRFRILELTIKIYILTTFIGLS